MDKFSIANQIKTVFIKINALEIDQLENIILLLADTKKLLLENKQSRYASLIRKLSLSEMEEWIFFMAICFEIEPLIIYTISKKIQNYNKNYLNLRLINSLTKTSEIVSPSSKLFQDNLIYIDKRAGFPFIDSSLRISETLLSFLFDKGILYTKFNYLFNKCINEFELPFELLETTYDHTLEKLKLALSYNTDKNYLVLSDDLSLVHALFTISLKGKDKKIQTIEIHKLPENHQALYECLQLLKNYAILNNVIYCFQIISQEYHANSHNNVTESMIKSILRHHAIFLSPKNNYCTLSNESVISIENPNYLTSKKIWSFFLKEHDTHCESILPRIIDCFKLTLKQIANITKQIVNKASIHSVETLAGLLWNLCRDETKMRHHPFLIPMKTKHRWQQLVLPNIQKKQIEQLIYQVKNSALVYREWGLAEKESRGLGITALFHGSSGTGKTMAAESIAEQLNLELYRIDLSQVVSKYIGETQKNLEEIFNIAEKSNAILLFDEADSLFAKRSETKDSRDRYSNMEISYLLSRMESYYGLSLLTTNIKNNIDSAFLRRFRFVVEFYYPDHNHRKKIWKTWLNHSLIKENIDLDQLAQIDITGASIRNVIVNAAFIVAQERGTKLTMSHLKQAIEQEFIKLERPLSKEMDRF